MRRTVYTRELLYIFERNESISDEHRLQLTRALFDEIWNPDKGRYVLRAELRSVEKIKDCISELQWITSNLRADLTNLFSPCNDDFELRSDLLQLFANRGKVAVFTGAGASRIIGIPSWEELAGKAIEWLEKKKNFSKLECDYLRREIRDPKQVLTIFHSYVKLNDDEGLEFYQKHLEPTEKLLEYNIYPALAQLECIKITTNIEDKLGSGVEKYYRDRKSIDTTPVEEDILPPQIQRICVPSGGVDPAHLTERAVYHLHGRMENLSKAVMTTQGYVEAYYNKNSPVFSFLSRLLTDYSMVFIGSSLNEFAILERILNEKNQRNDPDRKHFALMPALTNEMGEFGLQRRYLSLLGIEAIPYFTDGDGYNRLHTVLREWARQVSDARSTHSYTKLNTIREGL